MCQPFLMAMERVARAELDRQRVVECPASFALAVTGWFGSAAGAVSSEEPGSSRSGRSSRYSWRPTSSSGIAAGFCARAVPRDSRVFSRPGPGSGSHRWRGRWPGGREPQGCWQPAERRRTGPWDERAGSHGRLAVKKKPPSCGSEKSAIMRSVRPRAWSSHRGSPVAAWSRNNPWTRNA